MKKSIISLLLLTGIMANAQTAEQEPNNPPSNPHTKWQIGLGASYSLNSQLRVDNLIYSDGTNTIQGSADFDFKNVMSIELDVRNMPLNDWGFLGGLTYDFERKLDKGSIDIGNLILFGTGGGDSLELTTFHINAAHRWNTFYLFFGLNYSFIKYTVTGLTAGTVTSKGGIGAQLGIGNYINDHFVIEGVSRVTTGELTVSEGGESIQYKEAYLSTLLLTAKYLF